MELMYTGLQLRQPKLPPRGSSKECARRGCGQAAIKGIHPGSGIAAQDLFQLSGARLQVSQRELRQRRVDRAHQVVHFLA